MTWLSDQTLERRARRRLAKYGLKVKKHRGLQGGYTVFDGPHACFDLRDTSKWYADIYKLLEFTEYLHERYGVE